MYTIVLNDLFFIVINSMSFLWMIIFIPIEQRWWHSSWRTMRSSPAIWSSKVSRLESHRTCLGHDGHDGYMYSAAVSTTTWTAGAGCSSGGYMGFAGDQRWQLSHLFHEYSHYCCKRRPYSLLIVERHLDWQFWIHFHFTFLWNSIMCFPKFLSGKCAFDV